MQNYFKKKKKRTKGVKWFISNENKYITELAWYEMLWNLIGCAIGIYILTNGYKVAVSDKKTFSQRNKLRLLK